MQLNLPPDVEAALNGLVASGTYSSPEAVLAAAIQSLQAEQSRERKQEELRSLIQEGIRAADRGETIDADEVFEEILLDLDTTEAQP